LRFHHAEGPSSYTIEADYDSRRVCVTIVGAWTMSLAEHYAAALVRASTSLSKQSKPSYWLIDLSQSPVQPRDVAEHIRQAGLRAAQGQTHIIALVSTQALLGMQAKRLTEAQIFPSRQKAEDWLTEQGW